MRNHSCCFAFILFIIVYLESTGVSAAKLPNGFKVCHRSDPKIEDCLVTAIQDGLQLLKNGSKDLGLYQLDPLYINELVMEQGKSNEPFKLHMRLINATMINHSDLKVTVNKANVEKIILDITTYSSYSKLSGQYEMKGQMILLPVRGQGHVDMQFKGLKGRLQMSLEPVKKHSTVYLKPRSINYKLISFENIKVDFEDLFKGNKVLSETINTALNNNWESIVDAFKPSINSFFSTVMSDIINKVFSKIPYQQILPP